MSPDHSRPVVNLQVWYHVGSKDERTGRTGFAHLFEHLMFMGSKNAGPEEHSRYVRQAGGTLNAYTAQDQTVFWETFPSNYLERMLWLEADRMHTLVVSEQNFQKEREVVKEERRMSVENRPYGYVFDDVFALEYKSYPYSHTPIGSMTDLNNAALADVQAFYNTFYVPNNATLVITGDFEPREAVEWARKYFGPIPKSSQPVPRVHATEPPQAQYRELTKRYANIPLPAVLELFHLPPAGDPDSYPLELASGILSAGQSSRLYRRLVHDEQVAVQAAGETFLLEGPSLFFGIGIVNQGKDVKQVADSMEAVIAGLRAAPIAADELTKAKNQQISQLIVGTQSMQSKGDLLGRMAVLRGNPELANSEVARYQEVSAADVQRVAGAYLKHDQETRVWVYPEAEKK